MPPHFPKANGLVGRNDSKNPATTCKGVTSAGRPCRRDIAAAKPSKSGVLAVTSISENEGAAAYFCWQHKDQAEKLVNSTPANQGAHVEETHIVPLQQRNSVDSLVGRLGILDVDDGSKPGKKPRPSGQANGKIQRPPTWNNINGPLMSVPTNGPNRPGTYRLPVQKSEPGFWASLCCLCLGGEDEEYEIPSRPAASPSNSDNPTERLLSFIPSTVSPQTASAIMAEASKPISAKDEPGFIYIFWLTEMTGQSAPSDRDASSLLSPGESRPGAGSRNPSDMLRQYSVNQNSSSRSPGGRAKKDNKSHILLKIGRANNVHRRMKEWESQCGKTPSLVRFYPYVPSPRSSSGGSPDNVVAPKGDGTDAEGVRKVPHVHRVERLIHIELAEQRVLRTCDVCGREHKEWFEVEATKEGVLAVDEVVKRWVKWAEELKV
ncbi:meiotically up-regulated gene 113-domain-containing protein [Macrophomina phaseolina]|uniref:Meiotically up-regulated gene 113-domain-containing protein n=1 Tax=Macrophomina phaseolina TaxID=35725 RepID=A0ABQ8GEC8_9PEZI|nr:meiotically up-regulated gene 113-domain-containing protein [Macrophomina phaseolina]